jgi:hypothetical protein
MEKCKGQATVAHALSLFRAPLEQKHLLTSRHKQVFTSLEQCRTPALGGHVEACPECGHVVTGFNSCRNRHCPTCNNIKRERWIIQRRSEMLPVDYFHIVFTLPDALNEVCLHHPGQLYKLLFKSAWETMQEFGGDHKHLGAKTGMIAVLHTWGQNLQLHPHVHCLVPGGGLTQQGKWRNAKANGKYLFPVKAMAKVFRGKFCDGLIVLQDQCVLKLQTPLNPQKKYLHPLYKTRWVVFAKRPVQHGGKTLEYLGRYVHKVAIGNSRIKQVDDKNVTFSWFDYRTSRPGMLTLDGQEFVRRWSMHVLPEGFVKVRHYGICSNRLKMKARELVYAELDLEPPEIQKGLSWVEIYMEVHSEHPKLCPECKSAVMVTVQVLPPIRDGPSVILPANPIPQQK